MSADSDLRTSNNYIYTIDPVMDHYKELALKSVPTITDFEVAERLYRQLRYWAKWIPKEDQRLIDSWREIMVKNLEAAQKAAQTEFDLSSVFTTKNIALAVGGVFLSMLISKILGGR